MNDLLIKLNIIKHNYLLTIQVYQTIGTRLMKLGSSPKKVLSSLNRGKSGRMITWESSSNGRAPA
jgi:hypothetical protein